MKRNNISRKEENAIRRLLLKLLEFVKYRALLHTAQYCPDSYDEIERLSSYFVGAYLRSETPLNIRAFVKPNLTLYRIFISSLVTDQKCREARNCFISLLHLVEPAKCSRSNRIPDNDLLIATNKNAPSIDIKRVYKRHWKYYRERSDLLRQIWAEVGNKNSWLKTINLSAIIATISALFFISGFLYCNILLKTLGADVSVFFSVSDYLAVSVDIIRYAALTASIILLTCIGDSYSSRSMCLPSEAPELNLNFFNKKWSAILIVIVVLLGQFLTSQSTLNVYFLIGIYCSFGFLFSRNLLVFFKSRAIQVSIATVTMYLSVMLYATFSQVNTIKHGGYTQFGTGQFEFKNNEYNSLQLLMANSEYVFLINPTNAALTVLPKEELVKFTTNPK
jgi:hypothetical protein